MSAHLWRLLILAGSKGLCWDESSRAYSILTSMTAHYIMICKSFRLYIKHVPTSVVKVGKYTVESGFVQRRKLIRSLDVRQSVCFFLLQGNFRQLENIWPTFVSLNKPFSGKQIFVPQWDRGMHILVLCLTKKTK